MIRHPFFVAVLFPLAVAGCAAGRVAEAPAVYDFGPTGSAIPGAGRPAPLAVDVRAPGWLDGGGILYRLAYDDPARLREYAHSRWAGQPSQLLAQRLRQRLAAGAGGGCLLRVDLDAAEQTFDTAAGSRSVLRGRAALLDARRSLIAERSFDRERPAGSADARGGVAALVAASDDLAADLAAWLDGLDQVGRKTACRIFPTQP